MNSRIIETLLSIKRVNNENIISNYLSSLKQKYNAVCLDIDGTITDGIDSINNEILLCIYRLLSRRVPIVFITGRGEGGASEYITLLISKLKVQYNVSETQINRIFALVNDGALLLSTKRDDVEMLSNSTLITPIDEINNLHNIDGKLGSLKTRFDDELDITYSFSKKGNTLMNIRVVLKTKDEITISEVYKQIEDVIGSTNSEFINLTKGYWNGKTVFQIGVANKGEAIKITEKLIGVPENSMLRIGDCGNIDGNDFAMLNCQQGFSVNELSNDINGCFPVIDNNGNLISGIDGTVYLLKNMNILPTICLEKAEEITYRKKFALVEKKINEGKIEQFCKYDQIFNGVFNQPKGFNGVFESDIGGIYVPMYEWELIDEGNELKKLFETKSNDTNRYLLRTDTSVVLRGSNNYYYFLANRISDEDNKEIVSKEMVLQWMNNNIEFFEGSLLAIKSTQNVCGLENRKILLGVLDNIRNYILICINALIMCRFNSNIIINFQNLDSDDLLRKFYDVLCNNSFLMASLCFVKEDIKKEQILIHILKLIEIINCYRTIFQNTVKKADYSKDFRVYREIDNFMENYITIDLAVRNIGKSGSFDTMGICGLAYGGIELPVIAKTINPNIEDVSVMKFNNDISSYRKKHSIEIRSFCIDDYGSIELHGIDKTKKYVLVDDNVLTAKTMQLALNTMYDKGISVDSLVIVRYPSINRIKQMFMENHGAVDISYFFDFIKGLTFPSPYSYMDLNDQYEDSLGVFDITREKILRYLYKNHDFKQNSEVAKLRSR